MNQIFIKSNYFQRFNTATLSEHYYKLAAKFE